MDLFIETIGDIWRHEVSTAERRRRQLDAWYFGIDEDARDARRSGANGIDADAFGANAFKD